MTTTQIRIRGYHEDRFGHVNNARYLELLEEARWAHLEERGLTASFLDEQGVFPVIVRLSVSYRRPASAGDLLEIETNVLRSGRRKVVLKQVGRFVGSDEICVEAEMTAIFIDLESGRAVALGDAFRDAWPELADSDRDVARA